MVSLSPLLSLFSSQRTPTIFPALREVSSRSSSAPQDPSVPANDEKSFGGPSGRGSPEVSCRSLLEDDDILRIKGLMMYYILRFGG